MESFNYVDFSLIDWTPCPQGEHSRAIYSLAWSALGLVTGGGDDAIRVFREAEGGWQCVHTVADAHGMDVNCVAWSPGTTGLLATCSDDETVKIWELEGQL